MDRSVVETSKEVFIGSLFTLGASILFLIGSLLAADARYKDLIRILSNSKDS